MTDEPDLFAWAHGQIIINLPKGGNVIDALPAMLRRIRIEKAYGIPRPSGDAIVLPMKRKAA